jgi:hypothetical protein
MHTQDDDQSTAARPRARAHRKLAECSKANSLSPLVVSHVTQVVTFLQKQGDCFAEFVIAFASDRQ